MLDMGTGGGDVLSSLPRPPRTVATEGWPPNVPVAAKRLRPLGVGVVQYQGAPDNDAQHGAVPDLMPIKDGAFDLRVVGWAVPEYSREQLRAAWADPARWPAEVRARRFLLVAERETT